MKWFGAAVLGFLVGAILALMFADGRGWFEFGLFGAAAFLMWVHSRRKEPAPAPGVAILQQQIDRLTQRVMELEQRQTATLPAIAPAITPASNPALVKVSAAAEQPPKPIVLPAAPVVVAPIPSPVAAKPAVAPTPAPAATVFVTVPPTAVHRPPPPPAPPPPPPIPLRERLPAPVAEFIFGGNVLVKLGVLILFLGLAFLLRYTAERVTVPIELRYAGVALVGMVLLAIGWKLRQKRRTYALVLQGAGVGVFYLTTIAAMKISELLPPTIGFGFMVAVAVLGALLAVLQDAPMLALVATLEGFAAPVLASTGQNRPVALFTYLLILDLGVALIAARKAWRPLNLVALVGTFTLASGWAERNYTPDQFGIVEPFLIAFFLLFTAVGLMFARQTLKDAPAQATLGEQALQALRRVGRVDSSLVFGVPMVAFGMQYLLMRPYEMGAALSAAALFAFYIALAWLVLRTQAAGLRLLAEAYAIVGVIFGTLAIPLGLEDRWTSASWAVEAAGMYWLGARQRRGYTRAFAYLVMAGAIVKLLATMQVDGAPGHALLSGTWLGPLMLAGGALAMWSTYLRRVRSEADDREAGAAMTLPWIGLGGLSLLAWQTLLPDWAAVCTVALGLVAYLVARRWKLPVLGVVSAGLQAIALAAFLATLHRSDATAAYLGGDDGLQWLAALLIALGILARVAMPIRDALHEAQGRPPSWPLAQVIGVLAGVSLLHLALLFHLSLWQAAALWPLTALVVFWLALRLGMGALALWSAAMQGLCALLLFAAPSAAQDARAFAHLGFGTAMALAFVALLAAEWLRTNKQSWSPSVLTRWLPLLWGLAWWAFGTASETLRVLDLAQALGYLPAALLGLTLFTSMAAVLVARWRGWQELGLTSLATLPVFVLIGGVAALGEGADFYLPSSHLGFVAWPAVVLWHFMLLRQQPRWLVAARLAPWHMAGLWLFTLLAGRECQWMMGQWGDDVSAWSLLGWVLVPLLVVYGLSRPFVLARWPVNAFRQAYLEWAALPLAAALLLWVWTSNVLSDGAASPLPFVPLLNPLELGMVLALAALALWVRALPEASRWRNARLQAVVFGASAFALYTGALLRACSHYGGVAWDVEALHDSWLAQVSLTIGWAICGVAVMVLGTRRVQRVVWVVGACLLGVVVAKLFLVDLADRGGLFRIVSFLSVGVLLLLVGYFSPVPPRRDDQAQEVTP